MTPTPRKMTVPDYQHALTELLEDVEALAESRDEDAASLARRAKRLRELRPRGA
jgi:hypothetical protein